jgi:tricarballylate dehydrogenase
VAARSARPDLDVLIVGSGIAGTAAAVSAAEAAKESGVPLNIIVLDRADSKNWGGNSRWTGAFFQLEDDLTVPADLRNQFLEYSQGKADPKVVDTFLKRAVESVEWLRSKGVEFETKIMPRTPYLTFTHNFVQPAGGGLSMILALDKVARGLGVQVAYETTAWKLSLDENGAVNGVFVRDREGKVAQVPSSTVILACGGFEGNPEMLASYLGPNAYALRMYSLGEQYNRGEGIRMVDEIGGKMAGQFGYVHGGPGDPRSSTTMPLIDCFPYGIIVNKLGKRFVDEGAEEIQDYAGVVGLSVLSQPDNLAYLICDQKLRAIPKWERSVLTDQPQIQSESLPELARLIGVPTETLVATVDEFNKSVQKGEYDPFRKDGKGTKGIDPPKSNWALPIDTPPFICYPISCYLSHTCGGIAIDEQSRALTKDDRPVPGLYAAGELTGIYYFKHVIGTSAFRALVFGRIAGAEAVKYVLSQRQQAD